MLPGALGDGEVAELELELGLDEAHPVLPHLQQHVADVHRTGALLLHLNLFQGEQGARGALRKLSKVVRRRVATPLP